MKKNSLIVLSFLFMALGILFGGTSVRAAELYTSDDGNYTFEILEDGTVSIYKYLGTETDVTVPATITGNGQSYSVSELGSAAFKKSESVLNVTISEGINIIREGVFYKCSNLKTVKIPSTAKFYDGVGNAFEYTDSLEYIDVDDDNQRCFDIDGVTFEYSITAAREIALHRYPSAKQDTTYVIPEDTDYIYFDTFQNMAYLQKLVFPKYMKTVGIDAVKNPLNPIEIYLTTTDDLTAYRDKCFNKLPAGSKVYVQTDALAEEAVRLLNNSPDAEIVSLESNPEAGVPCTSLTFADGSTEKEVDMGVSYACYPEWKMEPYGATDTLTWTSSDTTVAIINEKYGYFQCVGEGTAVITGADQHGHTISFKINGYVDITGININYINGEIKEPEFDSRYTSDNYSTNVSRFTVYASLTDFVNHVPSRYYDLLRNVEIIVSDPNVIDVKIEKDFVGSSVQGKWCDSATCYVRAKKVGTATVYVKVTDYDGTIYESNKITYVIKEDISKWWSDNFLLVDTTDYTGYAITPKTVVTDGTGKILVEGTDYTVAYENNIDVGRAKCIVSGIGYYYGKLEYEFNINKPNLMDLTWLKNGKIFKIEEGMAYGIKKSDRIVIKNGDTVLKEGIDYELQNAGDCFRIIGKGNYETPSFYEYKPLFYYTQNITGKTVYNKTYKKNQKFSLNCKAETALIYVSSDTSVATVNNKGKVTIKGHGRCTITVTAEGSMGYKTVEKTITINVKPKKIALSKVKSSRKKTITVTWKKGSMPSAGSLGRVDGYEIQYSTNKSFKKAKKVTVSLAVNEERKNLSTTIKKLKAGKKYYVRVRAYVIVDGKQEKLYSSYSDKKTVRVKK